MPATNIRFTIKSADFGSAVAITAIVDGIWPQAGSDACWMICQGDRVRTFVGFHGSADAEAVKAAVTPFWMGSLVDHSQPLEWLLSRG